MTNWYQRIVVPRMLNFGMGSKEFERVRRAVLKDASGTVLEIGVGPGYNIPLYNNISKLYALEPSEELIKIAKARMGPSSFPIEFITAGAEHIPLPDHSIDTVVSTWTLCSVTDPEQVLQEIKRVLRLEGRFVFADHGASPNVGLRLVQTVCTSVSKYFTGNCHYDRDIEGLIKKAGFAIRKIDHPQEKFSPLIYNYQGLAVKA